MTEENRIPKSQLEEMFTQIREESPWNVDEDMVWGYFFTDSDPAKLERAGLALERDGYEFVGIMEPSEEDQAEDDPIFFLHVAKVETHSPDTLHSRNQELYAFAAKHDLLSYDGMDVGPLEMPEE